VHFVAEIERDDDAFPIHPPLIGENIALGFQHRETTDRERRMRPPQCQQRVMKREDRARIVGLRRDVARCVIRAERQPRSARREPRSRARIPRHRRPHRIAAEAQPRLAQFARILHHRSRDRDVLHPDLVAVVHRRRAAQSQQQHRRDARLRRAHPARDAWAIMIAEHPIGPAAGRQRRFIVRDQHRQRAGVPRRLDQLEVEGQMHLGRSQSVIVHQLFDRQVYLADQHAIAGIGIGDSAHFLRDIMHLRLIRGMHLKNAVHLAHRWQIGQVGRIVREALRLHHVPQHVNPEAIDTAIEPEAQHVHHRRAHRRVAPVEIGLFLEEGVVIILPGRRVPGPGRSAEIADPVIGRAAVRRGVMPQIPVTLRIIPRRAALDEPAMPVGRMVGHEIEQQLEPACMRRR
jgi:hypothetical protein